MTKLKATASVRNGVAAIAFRRSRNGIKFLVTHRILRWRGWEILKGGTEPGESKRQALVREMKEELDLNKSQFRIIGIVPDAKISFKIPPKFRKQMGDFSSALYTPFYLVEIAPTAILGLREDDAKEHDRLLFVSYPEALKLITYGNVRAALRKAMKMIMS